MKKKAIIFLFILSLLLGVTFRLSEGFSEWYTLKIAPFIRLPLSLISSVFPFSLAESFICILILFLFLTIGSGIIRIFTKNCHFKVYARILICSLAFIYFSYVFIFESSYSRITLAKAHGLETVEMSAENVSLALESVALELEKISDEIPYIKGKPTSSGMSFNELSDEVLTAAKKASEKYSFYQPFVFRAKPIAFSRPLVYTGISGIYTFFTGESNVNTEFSHYSLPFTIAHEYSHQMGIGSERDAEFSALLICLESDNPYIKYSAYSQVAITLSNLLFTLDEEEFYQRFSTLPESLVSDIYFSSLDHQRYSETLFDEIATTLNDTYLSLSGDEGVISYNLSAQLYVAYFVKG